MINHVRTLLLNMPASSMTPMGEYVPLEFNTVAVPSAVQRARDILFGPRPDATMLDYRLRQYMTMLHSTELVEFVTAQDPRITYAPGSRAMSDFDPAAVVTPVENSIELFITGNLPRTADGRMSCLWQVKAMVAGSTSVSVTRRSAPPGTSIYPITYTGGLSNEFPLTGSPLLASFQDEGVVDGITWNVSCLAMPLRDPGQVAADLGATGANIMPFLFGIGAQEPYRTWQNLWASNQPLPYRLGAALLAVAARTDEARLRIN